MSALWTLMALLAADPSPGGASGPPRLFVLKLEAAPEVDAAVQKLVSDLVVTNLQATGRYHVTSAGELADILGLEAQRQLAGCSDQSCIAESAGALGARYVVGGNVTALGGERVLTLRLIDADEARLGNQLTRNLPESNSDLDEAVKRATFDLVGYVEPTAWYQRPWILGAIGLGVGAIAVGSYFVFRPEGAPEGALGTVTLDAQP